jgi:diguanylate cyclase (GGDEF)-like protein/PAS domain S-box-containing protein
MPHAISAAPASAHREPALLLGGLFGFLPLPRYFRQLRQRGQVVLCQLPLTLTLILVTVLTLCFSPSTMDDGIFGTTIVVNALLLALCAVVPWEKMPDGSYAVIPALDCLALGFARELDPGTLSVLGLLAVFPVVWLSVGRSWANVLLAALAATLSAVLPPLAAETTIGAPTVIRMVLFPVIMASIAVTAHLAALGLRSQRLTLERKDRELEHLLSESRRQRAAEREAAAKLRRSDERFQLTFDHAPIGVALVSLDPDSVGSILRANPAFCNLLGREAADVTGSTTLRFTAREDKLAAEGRLAQMLFGAVSEYAEPRRLVHADGRTLWTSMTSAVVTDDDGSPSYLVAQFEDITARREAEELLTRQATHDTLTGLPNRLLLMNRISQALTRAKRQGTLTALLFLDVDNFKTINDSQGHAAGDALLTEVSRRLNRASRKQDTVGRLGGDEFVVLCEDLPDRTAAEALGQRILKALSTPQDLDGDSVAVSTSIGIAFSGPEITADELLRDADKAMYRAKAAGGGCVKIHDSSAP